MLDEWGGCGFPPARPSWLTDLWMTLSPPLSLRSHIPQQCPICPAAQSATIWNGFVLKTPKWLQITLFAVLCHSGCCRCLPKKKKPNVIDLIYPAKCHMSHRISIISNWSLFCVWDIAAKVLLFVAFLCRRGCLAAKLFCPAWLWCRPVPWQPHPKKWWLPLAMDHLREKDLTVLLRATWSSRLEWAVHHWLEHTREMWI